VRKNHLRIYLSNLIITATSPSAGANPADRITASSYRASGTVKVADGKALTDGTLTLNFDAATTIPAGTPFIIK